MRGIQTISKTEYREKYEQVFSRVFASNDPFEDTFTETVPSRALLHSVLYEFDRTQFVALRSAARAILDHGVVATCLWPVEDEDCHWYIPLNELERCHALPGPIFVYENAIFSPSGQWGLMFSHENFAVLGGEQQFIDVFFEKLSTSVDEQVHVFLRDWREDAKMHSINVAWIPPLIRHLFGAKKAKELLTEGGWIYMTFAYDGDGNRVKKDEDGVITHNYPGRHYEATVGSGSTKYYFAAGQLVAFDRSPDYAPEPYGQRYVFRDHLGSTSVIVNGAGAKLWEDRYLPYSDVRYTERKDNDPAFPVQTQFRYTGQWFEDGLGASAEDGLDRGLYFYGARWYDSSIARFIQPDSIVPNPSDPQDLNRYL